MGKNEREVEDAKETWTRLGIGSEGREGARDLLSLTIRARIADSLDRIADALERASP